MSSHKNEAGKNTRKPKRFNPVAKEARKIRPQIIPNKKRKNSVKPKYEREIYDY